MKKRKLFLLLPVLLLSLSSCGQLNSRATSESKTSESETSESQESEQTSQSESPKEEESSGPESPSSPESYTYSISIVNLADLLTFEVNDSKDIEISLYTNNPGLSGINPTTNNVSIVLDNDYMTIYGFKLTAYYPGETLVTVSWVESGVNLASTSFTVSISGEARDSVSNAVLSFSILYGGINQTVPTYSEAYVIGQWNSWSPVKLEEASREGKVTYETTINELSIHETYEYKVVLLYKDSDPSLLTDEELFSHQLTESNQSFTVHPDNEDGYVYNLVIEVYGELSSYIPQKTFTDITITFHIYMYGDTEYENELTPLDSDYATLYIYGFTGEEFAACSVVDNHYVLHFDSIEAGAYYYSALLYYADEELPDDIDESFWEAHKVNDGAYGNRVGDEEYIIDGSFMGDGSSVDATFFAGVPLEDLVPDRTVYPKYNVTINFTITVVGTATEVSPLDYGTLYIYGLKGEEFIACEQDEDTLKYSLTIDEIDAGTYKYSALIYYSDEDLPSGAASDPEFWAKYKVNTGEYGNGLGDETLVVDKTLEETGGIIDATFSALKPLEEILEDLRVYDGAVSITFNITAYNHTEPETPLEYGTLYIYGLTGNEFKACEIENSQYVLHLDSLRAGTYKYSALIYYSDEELPEGANTDQEFWEKYKVNDGEYGYGQGDETLEVSYDQLVESEGAITTSFTAAQPLADILPEKLSSLTLEFHMWYNNEANEQYALSYMTCYFYSAEYDPDNFIACHINESASGNHYAVELPDLKPGVYSYSLILLYNDSGIEPDPTDDDIWEYKINDGGGMGLGDNSFTIYGTEDTMEPLEIDLACRYHLADQFPNLNTLENYTLTINIVDGDNTPLSCPDYGSIYIAGSFDIDEEGGWNLNKVTSTESSYTYTINEVYLDHEYFFDLFFVYDGEDPSGDHMITNTAISFTPSEVEGNSHEVSITLDYSLEVMFPSHDEENLIKDYTIYFDIYKESLGVEHVQVTNFGMSVFMNGTIPGANWGDGDQVFLACSYNDTYYGSDHPVYEITFDEIYAGSYTYKLVLNDYNYPGWYNEITDNQTLIVSVEDESPVVVTIESDIWFDQYWPGY